MARKFPDPSAVVSPLPCGCKQVRSSGFLLRCETHRFNFTQADIDAAVAAEREACADLVEDQLFMGAPHEMNEHDRFADRFLKAAAEAIRARGAKPGDDNA